MTRTYCHNIAVWCFHSVLHVAKLLIFFPTRLRWFSLILATSVYETLNIVGIDLYALYFYYNAINKVSLTLLLNVAVRLVVKITASQWTADTTSCFKIMPLTLRQREGTCLRDGCLPSSFRCEKRRNSAQVQVSSNCERLIVLRDPEIPQISYKQ